MANTYIYAAFLAAIPSILWLLFWWRKDTDKEPMQALFHAFLLGIGAAMILLPLRYILPPMNVYILLGLTALVEEVLKCIAVVGVTERYFQNFNQVIDGIIYAVAVALGFAFLENIVYLSEFLNSGMSPQTFWVIYFLRCLTTTFGHSVFTAIFGFAYANAYLRPQEFMPVEKRQELVQNNSLFKKIKYTLHVIWDILTLHVLFRHVLKDKLPYRDLHAPNHLVLEGIVSSIYVHLIYNYLAVLQVGGQNLAFFLSFFLLVIGWGVFHKFNLRHYSKIIRRKFPPVEVLKQ